MIRVVESRGVAERRWWIARRRINTTCRDPALSGILTICTRLVTEHGASGPDDLGGIHPGLGGCVDSRRGADSIEGFISYEKRG
jgi:hypothetical protein